MNTQQIIAAAIEIVLTERCLLSPGDAAAHASDPLSYEFYRYENGNTIVGYNGITKSFPMLEVFDPNIVRKCAAQIQSALLLPSKN